MTVLRINCPNLIELVWRRRTKFLIGMAVTIPAIPLPAPLPFGGLGSTYAIYLGLIGKRI